MANLLGTTLNGPMHEESASASCSSNPPTVAVDISTANLFELDLQPAGAAVTVFTITGVKSGFVNSFVLKIINGTSFGIPLSFNWASLTAFKWPGGTGPVLTYRDDAIDILSFTTYDNGTTWYGQQAGADFQ